MKRYFIGAPERAEWWEDARGSDHLARTVHEQERVPRDTGLVDQAGGRIFAADDREPIGFVRFG